jgi:hypothetical protein
MQQAKKNDYIFVRFQLQVSGLRVTHRGIPSFETRLCLMLVPGFEPPRSRLRALHISLATNSRPAKMGIGDEKGGYSPRAKIGTGDEKGGCCPRGERGGGFEWGQRGVARHIAGADGQNLYAICMPAPAHSTGV